MQANNHKLIRRFLLKCIGATIVFYLGLSYNIKNIGPDNSQRDSIDYIYEIPVQEIGLNAMTGVDQQRDMLIQEAIFPRHQSSDVVPDDGYVYRYQALCNHYSMLCQKIIFDPQIDPYDKAIYFASMVYIVTQTDQLLEKAGYAKVSDTLLQVSVQEQGGQRRGGATRNTILMNSDKITNYTEFFEVFTHELGHIIDLGIIQGSARSKDYNFTEFGNVVFSVDDFSIVFYTISRENESTRSQQSRPEDFCSGYGMTNPFEDFAECFNLYMNHNAYFRYIATTPSLQQKYNFLANLMGGQFLFNAYADREKAEQKKLGRRPWDTTKMR